MTIRRPECVRERDRWWSDCIRAV